MKDYLNFLSGGSQRSDFPAEGAGVDMRTAEPVHRALKLFDSLLDEMEALMESMMLDKNQNCLMRCPENRDIIRRMTIPPDPTWKETVRIELIWMLK